MAHNQSVSDVEERLKRVQSHKGVTGVIVSNSEGLPVKTSVDNSTTVQLTTSMINLVRKTTSIVRDLDPTNDLTFIRLRSKKHEIMVAPEREHILIVTQVINE